MKISTKTGDMGETRLMFNRKTSKDSPRVKAYGAVDDFSSAISFARSYASGELADFLLETQKKLVLLMTELATDKEDFSKLAEKNIPILSEGDLKILEDKIESIESSGVSFHAWAQAGESHLQAALDMARARCRFAEREIVSLANSEGLARLFPLKYINRLSDLLWLLAQINK